MSNDSAALVEERAEKYSAADRKKMAGKEAMPDGSYPVADADDLAKAIHAVGRGGADHDVIRKHIMARAKALGLEKDIPDNWQADGSLAEARDKPTEQDSKVASALSAAQDAVDNAKGEQALDPDRDTDPDDAAVEAHLAAAHDALTNALAAQARDGADDGEARFAPRRKRERHRAMPLLPEVRYFPASGLEVRANDDSHEIVITGAPIVYGVPYLVRDMLGEFEERMLPGVARDVINHNADVRFLFNHDGMPYARTTSGTMTLRDSPEALRFTARLDSRQQGARDLAIAIERGDVSQMSCGFVPAKDEWNSDMTKRSVVLFRDLPDISAVTYPCSTTTSIEIAQRMVTQMPVESRARLRRLVVESRAGNVLSAANKGHVIDAVKTLHAVLNGAGVDPASLLPEPSGDSDDDGASGGGSEYGSDDLAVGVDDPIVQRAEPVVDLVEVRRKTSSMLRLELELRKRRLRPAA